MFIKKVESSSKLNYFRALNNRMSGIEDELYRLESGFEGEALFGLELEATDTICLYDVTLQPAFKGEVQYDFIIVFDKTVFHFDVKNHKGDYRLDGKNLVSQYGTITKDPEAQLMRAHRYLDDIVSTYDLDYEVESFIIFINSEFFLNAPIPSPLWIMPPQVKRFLRPLKKKNQFKAQNMELARYILKQHSKSKYNEFNRYHLTELKTGFKCIECRMISNFKMKNTQVYKCQNCFKSVKMRELILFNLLELYWLKGSSITRSDIKFFLPDASRSSVARELSNHFIKGGNCKGANYVPKEIEYF